MTSYIHKDDWKLKLLWPSLFLKMWVSGTSYLVLLVSTHNGTRTAVLKLQCLCNSSSCMVFYSLYNTNKTQFAVSSLYLWSFSVSSWLFSCETLSFFSCRSTLLFSACRTCDCRVCSFTDVSCNSRCNVSAWNQGTALFQHYLDVSLLTCNSIIKKNVQRNTCVIDCSRKTKLFACQTEMTGREEMPKCL